MVIADSDIMIENIVGLEQTREDPLDIFRL